MISFLISSLLKIKFTYLFHSTQPTCQISSRILLELSMHEPRAHLSWVNKSSIVRELAGARRIYNNLKCVGTHLIACLITHIYSGVLHWSQPQEHRPALFPPSSRKSTRETKHERDTLVSVKKDADGVLRRLRFKSITGSSTATTQQQ